MLLVSAVMILYLFNDMTIYNLCLVNKHIYTHVCSRTNVSSFIALLCYYSITPVQLLLHCVHGNSLLYTFIGIVPSSVVLTGFQVMSRVFLTWAVTHSVREVSFMFVI